MIKFENVSKKFPLGTLALSEVSFEIEDKDFVFFVGPSGAGKTTILKLILHEFKPSNGTILINDFDVTSREFYQLEMLRRNIGMIFQDFKILFDKNVFENIALSLKVLSANDDQITKIVNQALELVGLTKKKLSFPVQLSAGEIQRVALA